VEGLRGEAEKRSQELRLNLTTTSDGLTQTRTHAHTHAADTHARLGALLHAHTQHTHTLTHGVEGVREEVSSLVNEKMTKTLPTGATPGRQQYPRPPHLARTSPHGRLLARLRAASDVKAAAAVPLPGLGDDFSSGEDSPIGSSPLEDVSGDQVFAVPAPPSENSPCLPSSSLIPTMSRSSSTSSVSSVTSQTKENAPQHGPRKQGARSREPSATRARRPLGARNC